MKKKALILAAAISMGGTQIASAGIPVTVVADPITMAIHATELGEMLRQLHELQRQLAQMEKEYESITGSRGLAGVIDSAYDTNVLNGINVGNVLDAHGIRPASEHGLPDDVTAILDTSNTNAAIRSEVAKRSLDQANARFTDLSGLVAKVNDSDDPKDIMDLQARIGAENAFLQNEVAKLHILEQQAQANQILHEQQIKQMAIESGGAARTLEW